MTKVRFYDAAFMPEGKLTYSVIAAIYQGQWVFVRHNERITWEIAGGHIEEGETPFEAAERELREETGSEEFELYFVATYSVERNNSTGYGRLYLAVITRIGEIPDTSEIAEVRLMKTLPEDLTYPDIQPHLFERAEEYLKELLMRQADL